MNCQVCNKPLGEFELEHKWRYHSECKDCVYCKETVHLDIVTQRVAATPKGEAVEVYHQTCKDAKLMQDYHKLSVTITQAHLDALNRTMQMLVPDMNLSIETNQQVACNLHYKFVDFANLSFEQQVVHVKMLEALTAHASMSMRKADKDKVLLDLGKREAAKFAAVREYRESSAADKEEARKRALAKAAEASKPKLSKEEKLYEKNIQNTMNLFSLSREAVIEMMEKNKGTRQ